MGNVRNLRLSGCLAISLALLPQVALADLTGADRAAFVKNFAIACGSNPASARLIEALNGTPVDHASYCGCVADAYADRLAEDSIGKIREIERLALADRSRTLCLNRVFPEQAPVMLGTSGRQHYPADAETAKSLFADTTGLRTIVSADSAGPATKTQIMLLENKTGFFCWSEPLSSQQVLSSTDLEPVISALWCETGAGGYAEIFRIGPQSFVVGFSLQDGRSEWQVNEITIE
jgi:hypothetical protein